MMKRSFFAASSIALIAATPALAGGYEPPVVEQPVVVPIVEQTPATWEGGYVGGNLNYGKSKVKFTGWLAEQADELGRTKTFAKPDGASAAIRAGYDWQRGAAVFGVGAEYNFGKYKSDVHSDWVAAPLASYQYWLKKTTTVFGRAGYAVNDDVLAYGLLGYTWSKLGGDGHMTDGTYQPGNTMSLKGPTLGAGVEYRFADNWSGYAEYTYTKFKEYKLDNPGIVGADNNGKVDLGQIKLGVNYRF